MPDEAAGQQRHEQLRRRNAWNDFLELETNTGFMQSSWWADLMVDRGWGHFGTVLRHGGAIVGGAVIWSYSFKPDKCFYFIPEGPVLLEQDSATEQEQVFCSIMDFVQNKRKTERQTVSHLRIEPRWTSTPDFVRDFTETDRYFHLVRNTLCNDLSSSESDIIAKMRPKARYNIKVARRYGVSVIEDVSEQGIEDFVKIYDETCNRKDIKGLDSTWFRELIPTLAALGRGSVFFAEYEGVRIATALVVYFGSRATYLYGASLPLHRSVMAPYLLHFEIMRKAKAMGIRCYDWFGVAPQGNSDHSWADISVFKRKFGGEELRLVPTMDYVYDPVSYAEWRAIEDED